MVQKKPTSQELMQSLSGCLPIYSNIYQSQRNLCNHFQAAYQYGMKVSDGRKTKGKIGQKNEKAKLDKEWNKVNLKIRET